MMYFFSNSNNTHTNKCKGERQERDGRWERERGTRETREREMEGREMEDGREREREERERE